MDVVFTEAVQLGLERGESFIFEERLVAMTDILERPLPELRGGLIFGAPAEGDWFVECSIRPPLTTPSAETFVFCTIDRSWNEAAVRVIQESIARLAYLRDYLFLGTRFEMLGRRGEDGIPLPLSPDPDGMGPHLEDMEILLHRTQCRLDDLRIDHHTTAAENRALTAELGELRTEHHVTSVENGALARQLFDLRKEHEIGRAHV